MCRRVWPSQFMLTWCLWNSVLTRGDIVLRRNGYTGVTIALSPRLSPERLPDDFAHTVAQLVDSASKKVYQELEGRAFFEEVTLLVPSSLNASAIASSSTGSGPEVTVSSRPSFGSSHFWIEPDGGSVFGAQPYTLQYGPCGVQGLRTVLPFSYAAKTDGEAMAREWFRLRYGVFSEQPVPGDPLYSLDAAVTKHGVLCGSRKPQDVILQSDDLRSVNREASFKSVKLSVVQEAALRLAVVWNVEAKGTTAPRPYATTLIALQKLAQTMVPKDAKMALVAYSATLFLADNQLIPMERKREQFAKSYPRSTGATDTAGFQKAIVKALDLLGSDAERQAGPQGTILIISHDEIPIGDLNAARQHLAAAQVRIHALLLSGSDTSRNVEQLCSDFDGNAFLAVTSENKALFYTYQANAMAELAFSKTSYADTKAPILLKQTIIEPLQRGEVVERFYVDSLASVTLRVALVYENADEMFDIINGIVLSSPADKTYDVNSEELTGEPFNVHRFKVENASSGQWTLRLKHANKMSHPMKLEVWLEPTFMTEPPVSLSAWLSTEFSNVDPSKPFLIYAEARKGSNPIRHATITATVIDPEGHPTELRLVDNGAGDPDITAGDGIYSRYFTGFSKKGHYQLSVTAEGTDKSVVIGNAAGIDMSSSSSVVCCGSEFPESGAVPSGPFSRHFEYGSFFCVQDRPQGDVYPPSRVTDLRVTDVNVTSRRVTLEWTAPGNDYDQGAATVYEIRYFDSVLEFAPLFETSGHKIDSFNIDGLANSPKQFGEPEMAAVFNFNCGDGGGTCYFALRASDDSNHGPVSNVVEVKFPTPEPPPGTEGGGKQDGIVTGSDEDNDRNYARGGLTSLQLALAIVLPLLFLLILVIIIVLVVCFRRRSKGDDESKDDSPPPPTRARPIISYPTAYKGSTPPKGEQDVDVGDKVSSYATSPYNGSSISPINSYSADYLMDRYEEEKAKRGQVNGSRTPSAPHKGDISSSSEAPSIEVPPGRQQVWTTPHGRGHIGLPSVRPYVTELRPVRSPPNSAAGQQQPPGFSTEPRRQTFV